MRTEHSYLAGVMHLMKLWTSEYTKEVSRKAYPSDVSNEEWSFIAPYLRLMREDVSQREHPLRKCLMAPGGRGWLVRADAA